MAAEWGFCYTHTHSASMIDCLFIIYAAKQLTLPAYYLYITEPTKCLSFCIHKGLAQEKRVCRSFKQLCVYYIPVYAPFSPPPPQIRTPLLLFPSVYISCSSEDWNATSTSYIYWHYWVNTQGLLFWCRKIKRKWPCEPTNHHYQ